MNKNEEQLKIFIARMNVFSQHKTVMAESSRPKMKRKNKKNKK